MYFYYMEVGSSKRIVRIKKFSVIEFLEFIDFETASTINFQKIDFNNLENLFSKVNIDFY